MLKPTRAPSKPAAKQNTPDSQQQAHENFDWFSNGGLNLICFLLICNGPSLKESRERSKTALAPLLLLDHRRSSAGPPLEGPKFRRITT
ncbi:hypothetical protein M5K25_011531 [Dendrobium thyrsiflorum]|uniref:Uncharacterized protein n=1 Tax=Dendrobium thyrsiflorum TaxID=117978 RepID=A0ABD0V9Z5_DENTH